MNRLIVFARNPSVGEVKSRLAVDIGEENALRIYNYLVRKIIDVCELVRSQAQVIVYYSNDIQNIHDWSQNSSLEIQVGDSLGQRMANAIQNEIHTGAEKVCLIGTDVLGINDRIIFEAFEALEDVDIVLGPAEDGGYYLVGMKDAYLRIFDRVDWGTNRVLNQTINLIEVSGLSYSLLEKLRDIDEVKDFNTELRRLIK